MYMCLYIYNHKAPHFILAPTIFPFLLYYSLSLSLWANPPVDVILHYTSKNQITFTKEKERSRTMVFSSIPAYLDPSNWNQNYLQQHNHQIGGSTSASNPLLPPPPQPHGGGSIRPGSMAERARMANLPMPETSLKCPRCESTNTKFCYFNNYSLSQPRHFCKACRRYWTRGGALRTVPVGGGCRRNKRSKSSTSKSTPTSDKTTNNLGPPPTARFMSPLPHFTDNFTSVSDMNLNYSGMSFHGNLLGIEQFPLLGGVDASSYQFQGGDFSQVRPKSSSPMVAPVKMEENPEHSLILGGNEQWNGPTTVNWTDLCSSSTSNPL